MASARQEREAIGYLPFNLFATAPKNGAEPPIQLELTVVLANKVQNGAKGFSFLFTQATA